MNQGVCIFLIVFAILMGLLSFQLGIGKIHNVKAGFMPFLASILIFSLSLLVLLMEAVGSVKEDKKEAFIDWGSLKKPAILVVALTGYALLLKIFGYLITSFVLMFVMFLVTEPEKWRKDIFIAAIAITLSFLVFDKWLQVRLPAGIFNIRW
jgi:Tripartite tricarboxylate transporter TctB family